MIGIRTPPRGRADREPRPIRDRAAALRPRSDARPRGRVRAGSKTIRAPPARAAPACAGARRRGRRRKGSTGNIPPASAAPRRAPASAVRSIVGGHDAQLGARRVVRGQRARGARRGRVGVARGSPAASSIRSRVRMPGRSSTGRPVEQSTMADSMPMRAAPPSSTSSASPNSSATCAAVVGLTRPKRLALGAAMPGTPASARRGEQGVGDRMRRAAQADRRLAARRRRRRRPAGARRSPSAARARTPRPGARRPAACVAAKRSAPARSATWTISGCSGRPPLEREDLGDRLVAVGARAEAVHGLGRKRDELAGGDQRGGPIDRGGVEAVEPHRQIAARPTASPGRRAKPALGQAEPRAASARAPRRRRSPR